jgi:small neutral amino acid transporter SnatA (MarC family)
MHTSLKWIREQKIEIAVIITISVILYIIGEWIEKHSAEHQNLAVYIPYLEILGAVILFLIQYAMMHKRIYELKRLHDSQEIENRLFYVKLAFVACSTVVFLFTDSVVAYSLGMGYFAFGFNAGTSSFPQAWNQLHGAEIIFPILSIFSLWCSRK